MPSVHPPPDKALPDAVELGVDQVMRRAANNAVLPVQKPDGAAAQHPAHLLFVYNTLHSCQFSRNGVYCVPLLFIIRCPAQLASFALF